MPAWVVPAIMGAVQLASSIFGAHKQKQSNMELARYQALANERYLREQLEYNSPKSQMQRFLDAGLNPSLMYSQGNAGNQSQPLQSPEIGKIDYQTMYGTVIPSITQSALAQSQIAVQNQKVAKDGVQIQVMQLQKRVLQANPLLDETYFNALVDSMRATAESKRAQATTDTMSAQWFVGDKSFQGASGPLHGPAGVVKLEAELQLLEQRFKLGSLDAGLKAEVLKSKDFQNAILEVQKKFIADGDIGPTQIYQFLSLLLMKLL